MSNVVTITPFVLARKAISILGAMEVAADSVRAMKKRNESI